MTNNISCVPAKIELNFELNANDIHNNKIIKPTKIVSLIQNIATIHSEMMHNDTITLMKNGISWVISKYQLEIYNCHNISPDVTVSTWTNPRNRVDYVRNYIISNDKILVKGIASWCLIDVQSRKLLPSDAIADCQSELITDKAIEYTIERYRINNDLLIHCGQFQVTKDYIDNNNHMNNVFYFDYLLEYAPSELIYSNYKVTVNYLKECLIDEYISIYSYSLNSSFYLVFKKDDHTTACTFMLTQLQ